MEEALKEEGVEIGKMERKDEKEKSLPWGPTGQEEAIEYNEEGKRR